MTDEWAGPDRESPPPIEIPLEGDPVPGVTPDDPAPGRPTNWRRVTGVSSIVGVVVGIVVAVVILTSGGDAGSEADPDEGIGGDATTDPDRLDTEITTPPTLAPLDTLPAPDFATADDAPVATTSQHVTLFDVGPDATVPSYGELDDVASDVLANFALDAAVANLSDDVSRRARTRYEVGMGGFALDVVILRDAVNDRYELLVDDATGENRIVIDVESGWTYLDDGSEGWLRFPSDQIADANDVPDITVFMDQLLLGPIRPDTIDAATSIESGPLVAIGGDVPIARRFVVTLPVSAVTEWARYRLGPADEAAPPSPGAPISFEVYVTETGEVRQVNGVFEFGNTDQLVVHSVGPVRDDIEVVLPDPADVTDPPTG